MVLALPVAGAFVVGLALGGTVGSLSRLRLRAWWLFLAAAALQVVAFPFGFLPWTTRSTAAAALWLASYGLLIVAAVLNRRITGVPLLALGLGANALAVTGNGGTMPVLPEAMHEAGGNHVSFNNSTASTDPNLSWLVDRWAAPDWIPFANVYSVGDVLIALGAVVVVLAAMEVRLPRIRLQRRAADEERRGRESGRL